jgi:N6-adenosine-specific RNA methylase IME4
LEPLRPEEHDALQTDIARRGVLVPVEIDEHGQILDGHHRAAIARQLGLPCPAIVRAFPTEEAKREHVLKLNLARRHLDPIRWGLAFRQLLAVRGVAWGQGARNDRTSATVAEVAREVGVPYRTARFRLAQTEAFEEVTAAAQAAPDKYGPLLEEVARTGRVHGAYRKLVTLRQAERLADRPPPLPTGPFEVIVADPPWPYAKRAGDPSHRGQTPYPTLELEDIAALPVSDLAAPDATLWLWTTNAHLPEAFDVAQDWGFTYKALLTWVKDRIGLGDWLRNQTEHCLLAVRGRPVLTLGGQSTVLRASAREHSRKPDEFYSLVDSLCPGRKVELFSRCSRPGWTAHGDQQGLWQAEP